MAKYGAGDPAEWQLRDIKRRLTKGEKKVSRHENELVALRRQVRAIMEAQAGNGE